MGKWVGEVLRGAVGNWVYALVAGGALTAIFTTALNQLVSVPTSVLLLLGLLVFVSVVLGTALLRRLLGLPHPSALSWSIAQNDVEWDEARAKATLRYVLAATARQDVRMGKSRAQGNAQVTGTDRRRSVAAGESYHLAIAFQPVAADTPSHAHVLIEQPYSIAGQLGKHTAKLVLHVVYRWGAAGIEPLLEPFDDDERVAAQTIEELAQAHWARNDSFFHRHWTRDSSGLPSRAEAESVAEQFSELDRLLEEGDRILEGLKRDQKSQSEELWRTQAEALLQLHFQTYLTDFKTARDPQRVPGGVHVDAIWRPLKRMAAQLEVLRQVKQDMRRPRAR